MHGNNIKITYINKNNNNDALYLCLRNIAIRHLLLKKIITALAIIVTKILSSAYIDSADKEVAVSA